MMLNRRKAALTLVIATLSGCGSKVHGTYSGHGQGFLDKLTFKPRGKVEVTFMCMAKEATYVVEEDKVKVTNAGATQVFILDDKGCLDGGRLLGKYCKAAAGAEKK
ncbi:MAG: hypothetical protein ABIZ80_10885 [Bryobacteraceae bacterium]